MNTNRQSKPLWIVVGCLLISVSLLVTVCGSGLVAVAVSPGLRSELSVLGLPGLEPTPALDLSFQQFTIVSQYEITHENRAALSEFINREIVWDDMANQTIDLAGELGYARPGAGAYTGGEVVLSNGLVVHGLALEPTAGQPIPYFFQYGKTGDSTHGALLTRIVDDRTFTITTRELHLVITPEKVEVFDNRGELLGLDAEGSTYKTFTSQDNANARRMSLNLGAGDNLPVLFTGLGEYVCNLSPADGYTAEFKSCAWGYIVNPLVLGAVVTSAILDTKELSTRLAKVAFLTFAVVGWAPNCFYQALDDPPTAKITGKETINKARYYCGQADGHSAVMRANPVKYYFDVSDDREPILPLNPIECYLPSMEVAALDCAGQKSLPIKLAGPVGAVDKKCAVGAACFEDGQGGAFCTGEAPVSPTTEQPVDPPAAAPLKIDPGEYTGKSEFTPLIPNILHESPLAVDEKNLIVCNGVREEDSMTVNQMDFTYSSDGSATGTLETVISCPSARWDDEGNLEEYQGVYHYSCTLTYQPAPGDEALRLQYPDLVFRGVADCALSSNMVSGKQATTYWWVILNFIDGRPSLTFQIGPAIGIEAIERLWFFGDVFSK